MVYCQVSGCNNCSSKTKGKSFHRFPNPHNRTEIFKLWIAAMKMKKFLDKKYDRKNDVICSDHFTESDYRVDMRAKLMGGRAQWLLKEDAVPSIFAKRPIPKSRQSTEMTKVEAKEAPVPMTRIVRTQRFVNRVRAPVQLVQPVTETKKMSDDGKGTESSQNNSSKEEDSSRDSGSQEDDQPRPKKRSLKRCEECVACQRQNDCGRCDYCLDKPRFGGQSIHRQKCRYKQCLRNGLTSYAVPKESVLDKPVPVTVSSSTSSSFQTLPSTSTKVIQQRSSRKCEQDKCEACRRKTDCRKCDFCLDKPQYGGPNKKRQKCRKRQCLRMRDGDRLYLNENWQKKMKERESKRRTFNKLNKDFGIIYGETDVERFHD
eukprot:XP_011667232.1 PREDICTED: histone-lysine N-methyltransferase 2B-like [Strongylocentrotus purpuratus]